MFQPSKYQQGVFNWVVQGTGHAVVKSVPGSGKSTTLIHASELLPIEAKAVFLAFNKSIEVELNEKLSRKRSPMRAQTINSFGFSALRATGKNFKVDAKKYHDICKSYLQSKNAYEYGFLGKLKKFASLVRMTLCEISADALFDLMMFYDIDFDPVSEWPVVLEGIHDILAEGEDLAKECGIIDFDDQIYLPVIWNLTPPKKDWIFVDESQDLNAARLELIVRSVNGTGRMLFVGDENQSIYGFAGADTESMNKIIERTNATVLPLSICYRCPQSHIDLCATIIPGLEARDNAPQGKIESIQKEKLSQYVEPGNLVLCRLNAPLVASCLALIREGIRAKVRGSDIGVNLARMAKKMKERFFNLSIVNFLEYLEEWRIIQAEILSSGKDADMKIVALDDKIATLEALYEGYMERGGTNLDGFYSYIENFFSDEQGGLVILSSVHKAKGLENDRVFILKPEMMPHPKAKPGWQTDQELNIKYVACSRSKDELYFVR